MSEIDKLTKLLEQITLLENEKLLGIEEDDSNAIIYGYDSDEQEEGHTRMNTEGILIPYDKMKDKEKIGDTSEIRDTIMSEARKEEPRQYIEYARRQGYYKTKNNRWKKEQIPEEYQLREKFLDNDGILNIDCCINEEELILQWINRYRLGISIDQSLYTDMKIEDFINYLKYKTIGKVFDYLDSIIISSPGLDMKSTEKEAKIKCLEFISKSLLKEFIGKIETSEEKKLNDEKEALRQLISTDICNIKYLDNFICKIERYFWKIHGTNKPNAIMIILSKFPLPMREYIEKKLKNEIENEWTLGMVKQEAKEYRKRKCIEKYERNMTEILDYRSCKELADFPLKLGCYPTRNKKYKKKYKFRNYQPRYRIKYKKFRKSWKPKYRKKWFRKKGSNNKQIKKKTCTCWICQEKGHYANECPNKNKNPETKRESKKLNLLYTIGLEPIEDLSTDEEIYETLQTIESESDNETVSSELSISESENE